MDPVKLSHLRLDFGICKGSHKALDCKGWARVFFCSSAPLQVVETIFLPTSNLLHEFNDGDLEQRRCSMDEDTMQWGGW